METIKQKIELKHNFTESEKAGLGDQISTIRIEMQKISGEVSTLNSEKKVLFDDLLEFSILFKTGFEMRDVDCEIQLNTPEEGKKTITRLDLFEEGADCILGEGCADGAVIWIGTMSDDDYRLFPNPPKAEPRLKFAQFGLNSEDVELAAESVIVEHGDDLMILDLTEEEGVEKWPDLQGRLILKFEEEDIMEEFKTSFFSKRPGDELELSGDMIIIISPIPPDQTEMKLEENESVEE